MDQPQPNLNLRTEEPVPQNSLADALNRKSSYIGSPLLTNETSINKSLLSLNETIRDTSGTAPQDENKCSSDSIPVTSNLFVNCGKCENKIKYHLGTNRCDLKNSQQAVTLQENFPTTIISGIMQFQTIANSGCKSY